MRVLRDYFKDPNMSLENLQTISTAGAGLLRWVIAMMNYYAVFRVVAPKRAAVATAERNLQKAQKELDIIQTQVCSTPALSLTVSPKSPLALSVKLR